jgi:hypothetical protein
MRFLFILFLISTNSFAEINIKKSQTRPYFFGEAVTDFTPHGTQPGLNFNIVEVNDCADCHGGFIDENTPSDLEYLPHATWAGSMMANATRDPLFWAAVDIANQDLPGVGDFCIRCHSPNGFYKGHTKNGLGNMDYANGCELTGTVSAAENQNNDYQGINCNFCHRQDPQGPNSEPLNLKNSNIWLDDQNCDNPDSSSNFGPCRKGPYNPPIFEFHAWEFSSFIKQGAYCGSCHNVSSPEITTNGVTSIAKKLFYEGIETEIAMPIEKTYDEWSNSLFSDLIFIDSFNLTTSIESPVLTQGKTCQDCHMPESEHANARAAVQTPLGSRAGNLKTHEFAGGNSWMPQVIKSLYGTDLDEANFSRSDAYDRTTNAALYMLQTKSALIETSVVTSDATSAQVKVKVTNLSGHKLPSGYHEGRRVWIHLIAKDDLDNTLYESGAYDLSTAVLTEDADIKVYESQQGIWNEKTNTCDYIVDGKKQFHFVLNNCILKDNRIPPLGFRGVNNIELKPVGTTYPFRPGSGTQQLVNYDETLYDFSIPNGTPLPITITATLKYQTSSKEYIEFLAQENTTPSENLLCNRTQTVGPSDQSRTDFMYALWENNGKSAPVDMVTSMTTITE